MPSLLFCHIETHTNYPHNLILVPFTSLCILVELSKQRNSTKVCLGLFGVLLEMYEGETHKGANQTGLLPIEAHCYAFSPCSSNADHTDVMFGSQ